MVAMRTKREFEAENRGQDGYDGNRVRVVTSALSRWRRIALILQNLNLT